VTLEASTSEVFLNNLGVRHQSAGSPPDAVSLLAENRADAVVYDAPLLKYLIAEQYAGGFRVLSFVLQRQDQGIALPQGSQAREPVNEALLRTIHSECLERGAGAISRAPVCREARRAQSMPRRSWPIRNGSA
jgi:ABC-type amino acid transport substrate-binding protein